MDKDHKHSPVPNAGMVSFKLTALLKNITLSAMMNIRKPAATISCPFLKKYNVSNAVAKISPQLSIAHNIFLAISDGTIDPIIPNVKPIESPIEAVFKMFFSFIIS